jgi:hypothetical protein
MVFLSHLSISEMLDFRTAAPPTKRPRPQVTRAKGAGKQLNPFAEPGIGFRHPTGAQAVVRNVVSPGTVG